MCLGARGTIESVLEELQDTCSSALKTMDRPNRVYWKNDLSSDESEKGKSIRMSRGQARDATLGGLRLSA